jgi:tetratricopeptide (TPR) repeat protein
MNLGFSVIVRPLAIWIIMCTLASGLFGRAPDVSQDYAHAEALVRQGRWDEGMAILGPLLNTDPRNLKALNLMGLALTGKGQLRKANGEFQQALRIDSQFVPALKNLAINEFTLKDMRAAERHFLAASKLAPDDPVVHAYLGEIAYSRHDYREAVIHLPRAGTLLWKDPNVAAHLVVSYLEADEQPKALAVLDRIASEHLTPRSQFDLGLTLAQHNLFRQATSYFEATRRSFPDSYDIGFDLALCHVQLKEYSQAINVLRDLSNRGHKTSELDNLLAEAYEGDKQTQAAIDALRDATLLTPDDEDNYLDLAALCMNHDALDLGMEIVNVGLHYHPQSERLIFQRGLLHAMQNQFELAERDFQQAAELAPEKNFSYVGLGVSYLQTGNLPQAIAMLRQRIHVKPDDPLLQYLLGEALIRSGANPGDTAFKEAQAALETSVRLNPKFAESLVVLAKIYLKENHVEEAIAQLEKARALDPKSQAAYSQLAVAYRRLGKPELAKQMLSSLKELNEQERVTSRGRIRIVKQGSSQDEALEAQQQRHQ